MSNRNPLVDALLGGGSAPSPDSPFNDLRVRLKKEAIKQSVESLTGYGEAIHGAHAAAEFLANTQNPYRAPGLRDIDGLPVTEETRTIPMLMPEEAKARARARDAEALRIARERSMESPLITDFRSLNKFIPADKLRDIGTLDGEKSSIDESRESLIGRYLYGGRYNKGDGTVRNNINLVGTIIEAFPRYAGAVLTAIPQILQNRQFDALPDEYKVIAAKNLAGIPLTQEEADIFHTARVGEPKNSIPTIPGLPGISLEGRLGTSGEDTRPTLAEVTAQFRDGNKQIQAVRDFFSPNISEKTKQNEIAARLYNKYKDDKSNFLDLIAEVAKAGADNPQGVLQILGDMAPDIATMFLSLGAGLSINALNAAGESFGSIAESLQKRLEKGEEISAEEISKLLTVFPVINTGLELGGDVALRAAFKGAGSVFSKGVKETAKKGVKETTNATLGEALAMGLGNAITRTAGAIGGGALSEGFVEGTTDLIEQRAEKGSWEDIDGAQAYTAAGMGALAGGGIPAGGSMARTAQMVGNAAIALSGDADKAPTVDNTDAQPTAENAPEAAPTTFPVNGDIAAKEAYVDAQILAPENIPNEEEIASLDLGTISEPSQESFNPIKATSTIFQRFNRNQISEEDARAQVYEIADTTAQAYEEAKTRVEELTPEAQEQISQEIERNQRRLENPDLSDAARTSIQAHIAELNAKRAIITPEAVQEAKANLTRLEELNNIMSVYRTYADPQEDTPSTDTPTADTTDMSPKGATGTGEISTKMKVPTETSRQIEKASQSVAQELGNRYDLKKLESQVNEVSTTPDKSPVAAANAVLTARDAKRNEVRGLERARAESVQRGEPIRVTIDKKGNVKSDPKGNIVIDAKNPQLSTQLEAARTTLGALEALASTSQEQLNAFREKTGVAESSRKYSKVDTPTSTTTTTPTQETPKHKGPRAPEEEVDAQFSQARRMLDAGNTQKVQESEKTLMALANDAAARSLEELQEAFDTIAAIHTPETLDRFTEAVEASYQQADPETLPKGAFPRLYDMADNAQAAIENRPEVESIRDLPIERSAEQINDDLIDELETLSSEDNPEQFKRFIDNAFAINKPSLAKKAMDTLKTYDADTLSKERIERIVANNESVQAHYDKALAEFNERVGPDFQEDAAPTNTGLYKHINGDPSSTLSLLREPINDPTNYARTELKQVHRKDLPLTRINNFMTTLMKGRVATVRELFPKDFLKRISLEGPEKLGKVETAIKSFVQFHNEFKEAIIDVLGDIDFEKDSRTDNPLQYFYKQTTFADGTKGWYLDENMITAMAAAAYDEITANASNAVKTDEKIARMAGLSDGDIILSEVRQALSPFEAAPSDVANNIGNKAVQLLGLRPQDAEDSLALFIPKLKIAIGLTTINALEAMDMMEVKRVSFPDVRKGLNDKGEYAKSTRTFVGFKRIPSSKGMPKLAPKVENLVNKAVGSSQAVNALLGTESFNKAPSTTPTKPASVNPVTGKKHPPALMKALNKLAESPMTVRQDLLGLLKNMDEGIREELFGVDFRNPENIHSNLLAGIEGKNADIRRKWDQAIEFLNGIEPGQELYLTPEVWTQQRVGYAQNILNPQQDKLLGRPLLAFKAWEATYDPSNAKDEETFLIALGESIGLKPDEQNREEIRDAFEKRFLSNDNVQSAVEALQKTLEDPDYQLSTEEQLTLLRASKDLGAATESVLALLEYAKYDLAKQKGETFTTTIPASVDGKSNGQILSSLFYATLPEKYAHISREALERGGFFTKEELKDFADYIGLPDSADYYQNTAKGMLAFMDKAIEIRELALKLIRSKTATKKVKDEARRQLYANTTTRKGKALIEEILGNFVDEETGNVTKVGRDLAKPPTISSSFGAGGKRAAMTLAESFEHKLFEKLEALYVAGDAKAIAKYVHRINALVREHLNNNKAYVFPPGTDISNILSTHISEVGLRNLREAVFNEIGRPTASYLAETNKVFNKRTASITDTTTLMHAIYEGAYDSFYRAKEAELVERGSVPVRETQRGKYALFGLPGIASLDVEQQTKGVTPYISSPFSSQGGSAETGLLMLKPEVRDNPDLRVTVYNPIKGRNTSGTAQVRGFTDMGVAGTSFPIHSLDNMLSITTLNAYPGLNMHDSVGVNSKQLVDAAKQINKLTADMAITYSPLQNMFRGLSRQIEFLENIADPAIKEKAIENIINNVLKVVKNKGFNILNTNGNYKGGTQLPEGYPLFSEILTNIARNAYGADLNRLNFMKEVKAVSQYATVDGHYEITPEMTAAHLAAIDAQLAELPKIQMELNRLLESDIIKELDYRLTNVGALDISAEAAKQANDVSEDVEVEVADPAELRVKELEMDRAKSLLGIRDSAFNTVLVDRLAAFATPTIRTYLDSFVPDGKTSLTEHLERSNASEADILQLANAAVEVIQNDMDIDPDVLGKPPVLRDNAKLVEALNNGVSSVSAESVIKVLQSTLRDGNPYKILLSAISKTISPNLRMQLITPMNNAFYKEAEGFSDARGWYHYKVGKGEMIYLRSDDFINGGVTAEVVLHELLHAALGMTIQEAMDKMAILKKAGKPLKSGVYRVLENLENVRRQAEAQLGDKFPNAFEDIHEFITWGMTNADFITALQGIQVKRVRRVDSPLTSLARIFRDTLYKAFKSFFKGTTWGAKTDRDVRSAFDHVIDGTAALFKQAEINRKNPNIRDNGIDSLAFPMRGESPVTQRLHNTTLKALNSALGTVALSGADNATLTNLVSKLEDAVYQGEITDPAEIEDIAYDAITNPVPVFVSSLQNSPFTLDAQQRNAAEVIEATLQEALKANPSFGTTRAVNSAKGLYDLAAKQLKPSDFYNGDWNSANQTDKDIATAKHQFLLQDAGLSGGKVNSLARFLSLVSTSKEVQDALSKLTPAVGDNAETPIHTRAIQLIEQTGDWLVGGVHTSTNAGPRQVAQQVIRKLNDIKRAELGKLAKTELSILDGLNEAWADTYEGFKAQISKGIKQAKVSSRVGQFTRDALMIADAIANGKGLIVQEAVQRYRDAMFNDKNGLLANTAQYIAGYGETLTGLMRRVKHFERLKQENASTVSNMILKAFDDEGKYLSPEAKKGVTNALLRTDVKALKADYSLQDIEALLSNPIYRKEEIKRLKEEVTNRLSKYGSARYVRIYSEGLGRFMATGKTNLPMLPLNVENLLARAYSKGIRGWEENIPAADKHLVEQLVTLHAIDYTAKEDLSKAVEVIRHEANNPKGVSGIQTLLDVHELVERESNVNFTGKSSRLKIKGYLPEITNPNVEMVFVELGDVKTKELEGYELIETINPSNVVGKFLKDARPRAVMVRRDSKVDDRVSGIIPLVDNQLKGTNVLSDTFDITDPDDMSALTAIPEEYLTQMEAIVNGKHTPDFSAHEPIPFYNENGRLAGFRYMMSNVMRDTVLERNNNFETLVGRMSGNTYDKAASMTLAKNMVKEMIEEYRVNGAKEPHSFLMISKDSANKELREIYSRLPEEIQRTYKEIPIRKNLVDILMGYKKFSIAHSFLKDPSERKGFEKHIVGIFENFFQQYAMHVKGLSPEEAKHFVKRLAPLVVKGERAWKEIAREIKSAIVIKSGVVLLANEYSNATLLKIHGVPLKDIFANRARYTGILREFKKNEAEFNQLRYEYQMDLEASGGVLSPRGMQLLNRIKVLSERLNSSPVKTLYDEGFLSTVAEDLQQVDDPYSYKNLLSDKVKSVLDKAPTAVGKLAETLYMSENTPLFKFMNDMTQASDFIARMTLYEHLTTRKVKPLSHEAALHEVSEAFVNYDIPLPRGLQYADDMMLLPFTKYFLSIQRVIVKNFTQRPLSSMAVMFASDYLGLADHVMEPFIAGRIGNNPVWPGIFSGMDAFKDILPIQAIRQLTP